MSERGQGGKRGMGGRGSGGGGGEKTKVIIIVVLIIIILKGAIQDFFSLLTVP